MVSGAQRPRGSSGSASDVEAARKQVRELHALVEEQQNVSRKMQQVATDGGPLDGNPDLVRSPVDSPCHAAFMIYLECENSSELKEPLQVDVYMNYGAKNQWSRMVGSEM